MAKKNSDNIRLEMPFGTFKEFLFDAIEYENTSPALKKWANLLKDKVDRMEQQENYSIYQDKTKTPEGREAARQRYLDKKGIPPEFRW